MDVSIIIVNYNTLELLRNCINSIKEHTAIISYEIIVVDNASSDGSSAMIMTQFPDVVLILSETNLGFGNANNLGVTKAKGKYVFLLNSDTLIIDNSINTLFNFMEDDASKNIGMCGGNLLTKNLMPNHSYSMYYPTLLNHFLYRIHLTIFLNTNSYNFSNEIKDISIIVGADIFMSKALFSMLGGFDSNFFMYVEDGELCFRVKKSNYRIVSNPHARFIHLQGASSVTSFKLYHEISSYLYYFRKYKNKPYVFLYKNLELAVLFFKCFLLLVTFRHKQLISYLNVIKKIFYA